MKKLLSLLILVPVFGEWAFAQSPARPVALEAIVVPAKAPTEKALSLVKPGAAKDTRPSLPLAVQDYEATWAVVRTATGAIQVASQYDRDGHKMYEAFDSNLDGKMDDWSIYEKGILVRREVDSNFDGQIDIWVYLSQAVYVRAYERDRNFDGIIDITKIY